MTIFSSSWCGEVQWWGILRLHQAADENGGWMLLELAFLKGVSPLLENQLSGFSWQEPTTFPTIGRSSRLEKSSTLKLFLALVLEVGASDEMALLLLAWVGSDDICTDCATVHCGLCVRGFSNVWLTRVAPCACDLALQSLGKILVKNYKKWDSGENSESWPNP